jgi:hypothetical protein
LFGDPSLAGFVRDARALALLPASGKVTGYSAGTTVLNEAHSSHAGTARRAAASLRRFRDQTVAARAARGATVLVVAAAVASAGCLAKPRWKTNEDPNNRDAARLFRAEGAVGAPRDPASDEIAQVPMRVNMRPCCAFGAQLQVRVGPVPIPFYFLGNMVDRRKLRHHVYDSGNSTFGSRGAGPEILHSEGNGLAYACGGGFIDIAHVRDYADTALYTITALARNLESGAVIPLPDEGAGVRIELRPLDPEKIAQYGRWAIAIPLGQWLSFQSSLWHEIATWFGWSTFTLFPEKVSAFSPDDLYSNILGGRVAAAVISQRGSRDEFAYNRNVDQWLDRTLAYVATVPVRAAEEAMRVVDGYWWDSSKRIPDVSLVLRRSFEAGDVIRPWLIPPSRFGPRLRAACGVNPTPVPIENPSSMSGIDFAEQASLVIELPDELASQEPFVSLGRRITQKDFPKIVEFIRAENRAMFGPLADRPDDSPGDPLGDPSEDPSDDPAHGSAAGHALEPAGVSAQ